MKNYKIIRPCLWFARGEIITPEKLSEYYTSLAIGSLLKYKYIEECQQEV